MFRISQDEKKEKPYTKLGIRRVRVGKLDTIGNKMKNILKENRDDHK